MIIPIILSGGVGARLWPLSREKNPKAFIKLDDGHSFIQNTLLRALKLPQVKEVVTVMHKNLYFCARDEYESICSTVKKSVPPLSFILEPCGRNSAPAIAVACQYVFEKYGSDATVLILSIDHLIKDENAFKEAVMQAFSLAEMGRLVTFGAVPTAPKTGYGYIKANGFKVMDFVEKPDLKIANEFVDSNEYLWNCGVFCFSVGAFWHEMKAHCPSITFKSKQAFRKSNKIQNGLGVCFELKYDDFSLIDEQSIDYALLEKSENVAVVKVDMGWMDIGSWSEFGQLQPSDDDGNHVKGNAVLEDVRNCVVHAQDRLVVGFGLEGLAIAETSDALLISSLDRAHGLKQVTKKLEKEKHQSYKEFPTTYCPWGNYTVLQENHGFKIKCIEVKPGAQLSLQKHEFRSEHWVVVKGVANVQIDDVHMDLEVNQSAYIAPNTKHRIRNSQNEILVIIEVQCGSYLGEDDIVRYDDIYGRLGC
jgi:mannose-1-phosphate guanylyltransferase